MSSPTPYERLMAEQIPTRPPPAPPPRPVHQPRQPWTPEEQDAHWYALCKEAGTPGAQRPHLRIVTPPADTERRSA